MLKFADLQFNPPETVYSWQSPDTGKIRMWAVDRLNQWLDGAGLEVFKTPIQPHMAQMFIRDRGVEKHRVHRLLDDQTMEFLLRPIIVMHLADEVPATHLTLDGHHRYVALHLIRQEMIPMWLITEEQARPFEIEDVPATPGTTLNVNAFSGLGID